MMNRINTLLIISVLILVFVGCGRASVVLDYGDAESFEAALNAGENLEGKTVRFLAGELHPDSAMGYNVWAGEHLNFISARNPDIKSGDTVDVKVTEITSSLGSWFIKYEKVSNGTIGDSTITASGSEISMKPEDINGMGAADKELGSTPESDLSDVDKLISDSISDIGSSNTNGSSGGQSVQEVLDQLDVRAEATMDGQVVIFATNNSQTVIDELELQINYLNESGSIIDMDSDGHDMVLPGYTVVSKMNVPMSGFSDSQVEYKLSIGDHPNYKNHSEEVSVESNPGEGCVIVKITNNSDVMIDEIEYDVVLYKGDDIVTITFPEDITDVAPGSTETEKVAVYNTHTFDQLTYGRDYDRIEVFLNQAHTFR